MVLQKYDVKEPYDAYIEMIFCLGSAYRLLEQSSELTHSQFRKLIKTRKDYIHYRDAAINKLELRDRRVIELKKKLNESYKSIN